MHGSFKVIKVFKLVDYPRRFTLSKGSNSGRMYLLLKTVMEEWIRCGDPKVWNSVFQQSSADKTMYKTGFVKYCCNSIKLFHYISFYFATYQTSVVLC